MIEEDAGFLEREERRRILVGNEKRKLLAGALDRLSTAFIVVGVIGPILSLDPSAADMNALVTIAGWISGATILHLMAQRTIGGLKI